jgi:NAD(P)-dependent dehydrogenase (short-subunit alcohol dehydrogenase family)
MRLGERAVVITGTGGGMGRAVPLAFAAEGASVVLRNGAISAARGAYGRGARVRRVEDMLVSRARSRETFREC